MKSNLSQDKDAIRLAIFHGCVFHKSLLRLNLRLSQLNRKTVLQRKSSINGFNVSSHICTQNEKGTLLLSFLVGWFLVITWPSKTEGDRVRRVHGYSSTHLTFCLETGKAFSLLDDSNIELALQ